MNFAALAADEGFLALLLDVSLQLASASDEGLDDAIEFVLGEIGAVTGADRAYVTLFTASDRFSNSHEWVRSGVVSHKSAVVAMRRTDFPWSCALLERGEVWHCPLVSDLHPEAEAERLSFERFGVTSILQVPMRTSGGLTGVLGFNHVEVPYTWSDHEISRLWGLSDAIGMALLRRDASLRLRAAFEAIERASRAKDELLSRVSHELRTPLHAILGFAELLDTPGRPAADHAAVQQIISSGRQLLGQVETLLDETDRRTATQPPSE